MLGFDYTSRIAPAALKAAGCQVVFRYLSQPGWPKNLTFDEAQELLNAGIAIVLNYETSADFMLTGAQGGRVAAQSARAQARALMAPATTRIFYSADFNVTEAQVPTVIDFLNGAVAEDGKGEVGDYGGLRMVQAGDPYGFAGWQTAAWSAGQWDQSAVARQTGEQRVIGGVVVDVNEILNFSALGAWTKGSAMSGPIPQGVRDLFPEVASQFTGTFDDSTAVIYSDAGARAAYVVSKEVLAAVNALSARMDPNVIAEAVVSHIASGGPVDVPGIAAAVTKLFSTKLGA